MRVRHSPANSCSVLPFFCAACMCERARDELIKRVLHNSSLCRLGLATDSQTTHIYRQHSRDICQRRTRDKTVSVFSDRSVAHHAACSNASTQHPAHGTFAPHGFASYLRFQINLILARQRFIVTMHGAFTSFIRSVVNITRAEDSRQCLCHHHHYRRHRSRCRRHQNRPFAAQTNPTAE